MKEQETGDWFDGEKYEGVCERCGREGGVRIGDRVVCRECYVIFGSCCMEFGSDDLWREQFNRAPADSSESTDRT